MLAKKIQVQVKFKKEKGGEERNSSWKWLRNRVVDQVFIISFSMKTSTLDKTNVSIRVQDREEKRERMRFIIKKLWLLVKNYIPSF